MALQNPMQMQHMCRFIECEPDVTRLRATDEDSLVVMASDGLWDVVSDQEACTLAQVCLTCFWVDASPLARC